MPHSFQTQPIEVERFYSGVISQRNKLAIPIRISGRRVIELYDAILSGGDAEISIRSTLCRRAGYIPFNSTQITGLPQKYYDFQPPSSTGQIYPIVDTTAAVFYVPPGATAPVNIFTKSAQGAQSSFFGLGNFLYIGNQFFSQKWDGSRTTNWGISLGSTVTSPTRPTAATASGWTNPTGITGTTTAAQTTVQPLSQSGLLIGNTFGFSIPAGSQIVGISVSCAPSYSGTITSNANFTAQLVVNGVPSGNIHAVNPPIAGPVFGGSSDLWGLPPLFAATVNAANFGVAFQLIVSSSSGPLTISLNNVTVTIYYNAALAPVVSGTSGTFTATQGYVYVACYGNSFDGNISNPTPVGSSTGPFSNKLNVGVPLTASPDPQVNQIRVFRTTDTGTGSVFLELPTSPYPNLTQTITDSAADNQLVVSNALTAPTFAFSPPPTGLRLMAWYGGRLWGAVGNVLYYSAGTDNFPLGNGASNWPPQNQFPLPTTITKLIPLTGGNGMLVWTLDKIHIVQGVTNPGFTVNVWANDIGARQENAVDSDGSTIYAFTSDRTFLQITSGGLNELSEFVCDTTDNFDPTKVYVCQHRSGSQDKRVFLTDGVSQIYPFNLSSQCWEPIQTPVDGGGVGAIGSIEITPGVQKLLKGPSSSQTGFSQVLQRDLNTFSDNGQQYTWSVIFGNIPITDPTQLANVDSVVLRMTNAGNLPTVSVLPNEIAPTTESPFIVLPEYVDEPPEANKPPQSYRSKKFYTSQGADLWTQMSHLQLQFQFEQSTALEEVLSWGLFPNESADENVQAAPQLQGR